MDRFSITYGATTVPIARLSRELADALFDRGVDASALNVVTWPTQSLSRWTEGEVLLARKDFEALDSAYSVASTTATLNVGESTIQGMILRMGRVLIPGQIYTVRITDARWRLRRALATIDNTRAEAGPLNCRDPWGFDYEHGTTNSGTPYTYDEVIAAIIAGGKFTNGATVPPTLSVSDSYSGNATPQDVPVGQAYAGPLLDALAAESGRVWCANVNGTYQLRNLSGLNFANLVVAAEGISGAEAWKPSGYPGLDWRDGEKPTVHVYGVNFEGSLGSGASVTGYPTTTTPGQQTPALDMVRAPQPADSADDDEADQWQASVALVANAGQGDIAYAGIYLPSGYINAHSLAWSLRSVPMTRAMASIDSPHLPGQVEAPAVWGAGGVDVRVGVGGMARIAVRPVLYAGEVVSSTADGTNRWKYTVAVRKIDQTLRGQFASASSDPVLYSNLPTVAYNLFERSNPSTGALMTGIDTANLTGTFALQPLEDGCEVALWGPFRSVVDSVEERFWFLWATTHVDGACA